HGAARLDLHPARCRRHGLVFIAHAAQEQLAAFVAGLGERLFDFEPGALLQPREQADGVLLVAAVVDDRTGFQAQGGEEAHAYSVAPGWTGRFGPTSASMRSATSFARPAGT